MYFPLVALALAATQISAAAIPMLDLANLVRAAESAEPATRAVSPSTSAPGGATSIEFTQCDAASDVSAVTISPCTGGSGTLDSPCEFSYPNNYTITITYSSALDSDRPRSGVAAIDTGGEYPRYAYPGQTFGACTYTDCPIRAGVESVYTFELQTYHILPLDELTELARGLPSTDVKSLNALTYNVTDWIDGPSLFCAGFPVKYTG